MSNSYAQPILRTAVLAEAWRAVKQLLEIADTRELEIDVDVRVFSAQALAPLTDLLPDADWWTEGDRDGLSDRGGEPSAHLPVWLQARAVPPDIVRLLFKAVGESPAAVRWDFSGWPEAPEAGLGAGGYRGAFVSLCMNVRDLELAEPAADHTVFVHVKQVEAERAPWLAARIGLGVIGDLVMAPY